MCSQNKKKEWSTMHEQPPVLGELHDTLLASFARIEAADQSRARRRRRQIFVGAAATAALACVLALVVLPGRDDGPLSVSEATASVAAATLNSTQPPADKYVHERTVGRSVQSYNAEEDLLGRPLGVFSAINESTDEEWSNPFRCSYVRGIRSRSLGYPSERDADRGRQWMQAMRKKGGGGTSPVLMQSATGYVLVYPPQKSPSGPVEIGGEKIPPDELAEYPTTPSAIHARIEQSLRSRRGSLSTDAHVWNALAWAPSNYGPARRLPEALRAGLVLALGEIPDVEVVGEHSTPSGATAITFAREEAGVRHELTLDKATGVTLAFKDTIVAPQRGKMAGWPNGTVIRSRTVLERELVDAVPRSIVRRARNQRGAQSVDACTEARG
jgi:hypothetical protein